MTYEVAKFLHIIALVIWVGMIPYEIYAAHSAGRTRVTAERLRLIKLANRFRICQEYPCIVVAFGAGGVLIATLGWDALLRQSWFQYKLGLLAYLTFAELYLSYRDYILEGTYRDALARGEETLRSEPDGPLHIIVGSVATIVFFGILFCSVFKFVPAVALGLIALAILPPAVLDLKQLALGKKRIASDNSGQAVLP